MSITIEVNLPLPNLARIIASSYVGWENASGRPASIDHLLPGIFVLTTAYSTFFGNKDEKISPRYLGDLAKQGIKEIAAFYVMGYAARMAYDLSKGS